MNAGISLGQFMPGNSAVHRLDPRTKILLMIAYIVLILVVKNIIVFVIPTVFLLMILLLARVPLAYIWNSIKPMRWLMLFMLVFQLFFFSGDTVWLSWWRIRITEESVLQAGFFLLRFVLLVCGTSVLTLTTSPIALTNGIERLLAPLKFFRFPVHELAMMMTIALRSIPTLIEEADRIKKAQMARGADFESGNLFVRAKSMIPILVPLFVSAFRRADELAMAMESRCYHGGEGRTRMQELQLRLRDGMAVLAMVFAITGVFFWQGRII